MTHNLSRTSVREARDYNIPLVDLFEFVSKQDKDVDPDDVVSILGFDPLALSFFDRDVEDGTIEGEVSGRDLVVKNINWRGTGSGARFKPLLEFLTKYTGFIRLVLVWESGDIERLTISNGQVERESI